MQMIERPFTLNNRFVIDPALHLVKDRENSNEIRLEPRLVQLLCLLSRNEGKLVSRELLITEIWNDYGGAEDGLNQAISFLRKALGDGKKEMIETIPKKGYVLHATIGQEKTVIKQESLNARTRSYQYSIAIAALFVIALSTYFIRSYTIGSDKNKVQEKIAIVPDKIARSTEASYVELNKSEEETYFNTVTTTGPDDTLYRLVAGGDKLPAFYINNQLVAMEKREPYATLIDNMLRQLWNRQKHFDDSVNASQPEAK